MNTDFSQLSTSQKKIWSARVWSAGRDQTLLFGRQGFMGSGTEDATKPVHLITDLTFTDRGDRVIMPIVLDLQNDGVAGDNELEGNEELLVNDDVEIQIDQIRNGVKSRGKMAEQKVVIRFRAQAKDKLAYWLADILEQMGFLTLGGIAYTKTVTGGSRPAGSQLSTLAFASAVTAPSSNRKLFPVASYTSTTNITSSDTMSWDLLLRAKAFAMRKRIKPVRVGGKEYYIVCMTPEQARDLKASSDYKNAVSRADKRGDDNKLFTGSFAMVDGLVLYDSNKVPSTLDAASGSKYGSGGTVEGAEALLLGAQALGFAKIGEGSWSESDNKDYENREGIGHGRFVGFKKPVFDSRYDNLSDEDFGVIAIYTAATA